LLLISGLLVLMYSIVIFRFRRVARNSSWGYCGGSGGKASSRRRQEGLVAEFLAISNFYNYFSTKITHF